MFKINNRNTRTMCETCSKSTPERRQWHTYFTPCSNTSIVNFEQVNSDWVNTFEGLFSICSYYRYQNDYHFYNLFRVFFQSLLLWYHSLFRPSTLPHSHNHFHQHENNHLHHNFENCFIIIVITIAISHHINILLVVKTL